MSLPSEYVNAIYKDTGNPAYKGNPFIEALTPIMELKQLKEGLEGKVDFSLNDLQDKPRQRAHMVAALLDDFFQPLSQHVLLEERISIMIRRGYVSRNLLDGSLNKHLQNGYERVMSGDLQSYKFRNVLTTATCLSLIGCSGSGKSSTLDRILATYPQVIYHQQHNFFQLSYLKIECPNNGSQQSLCLNFFREVDKRLATNYENSHGLRGRGVPTLLALMSQVANERAIGVLVIDEIQRLKIRKAVGREQMLEFFVELVNTVGIPVILVGTPKARPLFEVELQSARRTTGIGSVYWQPMPQYPENPNVKSEWVAFTNKLWKYQWLNRRDEVLTDEIRDCWYDLSQGVLDIVVKLFVLAQLRAIASKLERITVNVLRSVYNDELKPVHPMLDAIRRGNPTLIAKYSDLRVEDIDKRLLSLHQKINQIPDEPELPFSNNEQAMRLYKLLVQTDCQSEILIPLVEKIFREQPKLTMREMMPVILDWYDESKQFVDQQPKTPKATVVKRADWSSLETGDLRFVYSQLTKKEDMYSALKANKLILDLKKVS
ncbi:AAA family ATPase [Vibrio parahaemolyticus]|uniref:AAA family ATPase n=1 Tax=Vibrio TaxID=662 RepID=UPI000A1126A7|nr:MULTISPECIES: AAA family ATPase [Vibrio]EJB8417610.1 AAA family ATPase [Vibrio vulnificus]EGQ7972256.1 AAA family ATPase [Vibrio parahaemolyticus]EGQ7976365.1 AAA family ATPase [Vibrio parahaemolyticus]EGR1579625.1 transcriptional antiterminator [Vibrio parahaemolyticus]EGR1579935.1 transcriptional antiterminator [Vibrio parahaemolyticus]